MVSDLVLWFLDGRKRAADLLDANTKRYEELLEVLGCSLFLCVVISECCAPGSVVLGGEWW